MSGFERMQLPAVALAGSLALTAGCAGGDEPVVGVYPTSVIESVETAEGIATTIYDRDHREPVARVLRSRRTGLSQIDDDRGTKVLETGIPLGDDLAAYNAGVASMWERSQRIRAGTVAYGECGSGWNDGLVPDGWWGSCCRTHDECYAYGGQEDQRLACDNGLRDCMNSMWAPGNTYYSAVRMFGGNYFAYHNGWDCPGCGLNGS